MQTPKCVIIGTYKSGTSSLHNYLGQHPSIYASEPKETNFFAWGIGQRPMFVGPGDVEAPTNKTWYPNKTAWLKLFAGAQDSQVAIDSSPIYLSSQCCEEAAQRIHQYLPDAKLVALLRHPVERAFSNYCHLVASRRINATYSFPDFLRRNVSVDWAPIHHIRENGFYYARLRPYCNLFPSDQLRVYLYEDFAEDPLSVVRDCYRFLGVGDEFCPDVSARFMSTGHVQSRRMRVLYRLLYCLPLLSERRRRILASNAANITPLTADRRRELTEIYREDILRLADLLDRDLSSWLE